MLSFSGQKIQLWTGYGRIYLGLGDKSRSRISVGTTSLEGVSRMCRVIVLKAGVYNSESTGHTGILKFLEFLKIEVFRNF